jgi:hypothetical protein
MIYRLFMKLVSDMMNKLNTFFVTVNDGIAERERERVSEYVCVCVCSPIMNSNINLTSCDQICITYRSRGWLYFSWEVTLLNN